MEKEWVVDERMLLRSEIRHVVGVGPMLVTGRETSHRLHGSVHA